MTASVMSRLYFFSLKEDSVEVGWRGDAETSPLGFRHSCARQTGQLVLEWPRASPPRCPGNAGEPSAHLRTVTLLVGTVTRTTH